MEMFGDVIDCHNNKQRDRMLLECSGGEAISFNAHIDPIIKIWYITQHV